MDFGTTFVILATVFMVGVIAGIKAGGQKPQRNYRKRGTYGR